MARARALPLAALPAAGGYLRSAQGGRARLWISAKPTVFYRKTLLILHPNPHILWCRQIMLRKTYSSAH